MAQTTRDASFGLVSTSFSLPWASFLVTWLLDPVVMVEEVVDEVVVVVDVT